MTIIVGRAINGVSINGLEYLLNPHDDGAARFEDEGQAKQYLRDQGYEDDVIEDHFTYVDLGDNNDG